MIPISPEKKIISSSHESSTYYLAFFCPAVSEEISEKCGQKKGQEMTLTYINHTPLFTPSAKAAILLKETLFSFFSYVKSYVSKIDLAIK